MRSEKGGTSGEYIHLPEKWEKSKSGGVCAKVGVPLMVPVAGSRESDVIEERLVEGCLSVARGCGMDADKPPRVLRWHIVSYAVSSRYDQAGKATRRNNP